MRSEHFEKRFLTPQGKKVLHDETDRRNTYAESRSRSRKAIVLFAYARLESALDLCLVWIDAGREIDEWTRKIERLNSAGKLALSGRFLERPPGKEEMPMKMRVTDGYRKGRPNASQSGPLLAYRFRPSLYSRAQRCGMGTVVRRFVSSAADTTATDSHGHRSSRRREVNLDEAMGI